MANFKHYFNNNFSGCLLVATGFDPHRERDVRMYLLPGIVEALGVTDGVDKWAAPMESPFLENVAKAIKGHWAGDTVAFPLPIMAKRPGDEPPKPRRKLLEDAPATLATPRPRKALVDEPSQPQPPVRRRALIED